MISISRAIGFYIDSSAGGMDWFVMFVSNDPRVSHQHVCPQGIGAPLALLSAFAADYLAQLPEYPRSNYLLAVLD